jgi:pSer/pThr/pTyr-binding forkhead associated (FHA) protein
MWRPELSSHHGSKGEGWDGTFRLDGTTFVLSKERTLIGRHPVDLVLPERFVNRHHATICRVEDAYWLTDLASRTGTYLNRARITEPTLLKDGDEIQIGGFSLLFEEGANPAIDRPSLIVWLPES